MFDSRQVNAIHLLVLIVSILGILPSKSKAQQQYGTARGLILLTAEIINQDSVPLSDVHIYNQNNAQVIISDGTGFFSMYVTKTHVLRLTSVGYATQYFSVPADFEGDMYFTRIVMNERPTPLSNVTIFGKEEELNSMLEREEQTKPFGEFGIGTLQSKPQEIKPGAGSPLSLLYDWFSKEGKENRKLREILKQDEIKKQIDKRFESELIWELTGLYGQDLEKFKRYCNMPQSFVLRSNEYDFLVAVKQCFYNYQNRLQN